MAGPNLAIEEGPRREREGRLLLLLSALAFSTAGVFTRTIPVGFEATVFWRNGFGCVGLAILLLRSPHPARLGGRGWAATACSALGTLCYLAAFGHTSVANVSILYATAPLIAAALAWLTLGERPRMRTLLAASLALAGVAVTVAGSARTGTILGDALALLMTVALSAVAVITRGAAVPPLATAFWSSLFAGMLVVPAALLDGASLRIGPADALRLAAFGLVTMTVALPTYLAGAARVPAARAMLMGAAELPLAPVWVWLAVGEAPRLASLLGGAIVLAAILIDLGARGASKEKGAEAPPSDLR